MTYLELRTALAGYLHRSDLASEIIEFITRAEQRIGRDVRILENRVQATVTPVSGVAAKPTRFAEMRRVSTGAAASMKILRPVSPSQARHFGTSGESLAFYISDSIYLLPAADTDIDIDYYEFPEPLVGAADGATRPILTRYENLYIDAAMAEASLFIQDYEAYQLWAQRYVAEVGQANQAANQAYTPVTSSGFNYAGGQPCGI